MVHQYKLNGYNIVLDTCSGSVHVVDEIAFDIISLYKEKSEKEIDLLFEEAKYPMVITNVATKESLGEFKELEPGNNNREKKIVKLRQFLEDNKLQYKIGAEGEVVKDGETESGSSESDDNPSGGNDSENTTSEDNNDKNITADENKDSEKTAVDENPAPDIAGQTEELAQALEEEAASQAREAAQEAAQNAAEDAGRLAPVTFGVPTTPRVVGRGGVAARGQGIPTGYAYRVQRTTTTTKLCGI